jgi:hypothetical protein
MTPERGRLPGRSWSALRYRRISHNACDTMFSIREPLSQLLVARESRLNRAQDHRMDHFVLRDAVNEA